MEKQMLLCEVLRYEARYVRVHSRLVCAIGIIVVAVLLSAVPAFGQLIVQPMRIDLTPRPGTRIKTSFEIQNYDPNEIHIVDLTLTEISQWEDGTWRIIEPNDDYDISKLSSAASSGNFCPVNDAQVAIRSVRHIVSSLVVPGLILPGQLAMKGTRCPPS